MMSSKNVCLYVCLIVVKVMSSGCSGQVSQEPTATNIPHTPTFTIIPPTATPLPLIYTFDGEICTHIGPNEVPPGEYSIKLLDLTENDNGIWVDLFAEGYTRQDILDI